jgi:hypothetical protein
MHTECILKKNKTKPIMMITQAIRKEMTTMNITVKQ